MNVLYKLKIIILLPLSHEKKATNFHIVLAIYKPNGTFSMKRRWNGILLLSYMTLYTTANKTWNTEIPQTQKKKSFYYRNSFCYCLKGTVVNIYHRISR